MIIVEDVLLMRWCRWITSHTRQNTPARSRCVNRLLYCGSIIYYTTYTNILHTNKIHCRNTIHYTRFLVMITVLLTSVTLLKAITGDRPITWDANNTSYWRAFWGVFHIDVNNHTHGKMTFTLIYLSVCLSYQAPTRLVFLTAIRLRSLLL
jgi:hypothetical protein